MKRQPKSNHLGRLILAAIVVTVMAVGASADEYKNGIPWPEPKIVDPGPTNATLGAKAPSDAIVLFDGKNLSKWNGGDKWIIENGYAVVRGGGVSTKQKFGDCQLHIEWATPKKVVGNGQGRGNSGVYMMGIYELQILDSYDNKTYFDGQAGSIYKQSPPLVNASRKPGEWQSYDIVFKSPRFDKSGNIIKRASMTVLHNGILIQDHFVLPGGTFWDSPPKYTAHAEKLSISLQDHGNPTRFRNIWIRELTDRKTPAKPKK